MPNNNQPPVFTSEFAMRWGDMDALGHVNNSIYFIYMEQARIEWFTQLNHGNIDQSAAEGPILANAHCTFLQPITYPNTITVAIFTDPPGNTSFNTHYHIGVRDNNDIFAKGSATIVWMNYHKKQTSPIPTTLREYLEQKTS